MKVYTSLKSIPELSNLASNDRNELWNRHASKALFSWQTLLAFLFLLLFTAVGVEFRFYLKGEFPQIHWRYIDYPIMVCTYALGFWQYSKCKSDLFVYPSRSLVLKTDEISK